MARLSQPLPQRLDGPVHRYLQGGHRSSACQRRLLQGHFLEFEQVDGETLIGRQSSDRRMQGREVCGCVIKMEVRRTGRKGFMLVRQFNFARAGADLTPQPINDAPVGYGDKPRPERTAGS